jgi:hypothetical protein
MEDNVLPAGELALFPQYLFSQTLRLLIEVGKFDFLDQSEIPRFCPSRPVKLSESIIINRE